MKRQLGGIRYQVIGVLRLPKLEGVPTERKDPYSDPFASSQREMLELVGCPPPTFVRANFIS